jgi:2-oxoglutarate ferredoxin oxidoreductase subunit alpha
MKGLRVEDGSVSFLVGGEAGQGITRSGSLLGKALMRGGYHVFGVNDYPSVIRGSHNFYVLRASDEEVHSQADTVDVLLALNKETVLLHEHELSEGGEIVHDEGVEFSEGELRRDDINRYPIPLKGIVDEVGGTPIMMNTVALGAAVGLVGFDISILKEVISDTFVGRAAIIESNNRVAEMGHDHVRQHYGEGLPHRLRPTGGKANRIMPTGNDAIALGAVRAGCRFYAAYPMTPASPVLHYLAAHDLENEMVVIQTESEISAINMAVGASYAGLRAMTATSGGGFSLMAEALGLAAMTENPVVVMLGQRPGPSTGMATYTAQADLLFAVHASQGEFPRVVVAPGDVDECFHLTMEAFNLAERYQVPAIILADKYLLESHKSTEPFEDKAGVDRGELLEIEEWTGPGEYERYKMTESGVSPRMLLGTKGAIVLANSNEHVEYGYTTVDPEAVVAMGDKRFRKMEGLRREVERLGPVRVYGDEDAEATLVGWGSTKGPALEALKLLRRDGIRSRLVQVVYLEPFPSEAVYKALKDHGRSVLLEANRTAQLGKLIGINTGFAFEKVVLKHDGRPFNPGEICERVKEAIQ